MTTARDTGCETNFSDLDLRECTAFYTHTFQTSCRPDICPVLYFAAWCNITALTRGLVGKIAMHNGGLITKVGSESILWTYSSINSVTL